MGVQFEELSGFKIAHVGSVWSSFRRDYPALRDLDPLPPVMDLRRGELFAEIRFGPRPPRTWFIDEERGRLIQLQADRFVHNWRGSGNAYPRYEKLRQEFDDVWSRFQGALGDVHVPPPVLEHAELTYVNTIPHDQQGPSFMKAFSSPHLSVPGVRPVVLDGQVAFRCLVEAVAPLPSAELMVTAEPEHRDDAGSYLLTLAVRGPLREARDLGGFLDRAHKVIVLAFADVTTPLMHERWERVS